MSNILVFNKDLTDSRYLIKNRFSINEFHCKCTYKDCTRTLIYLKSLHSLGSLREIYGKPIMINSAFRCQKHNKDIGGVDHSYHKVGCALDLRPAGDFHADELDKLDKLANNYFDIVLRYEHFIHCHNRVEEEYNQGAINEASRAN